jgi:hypothetical protein
VKKGLYKNMKNNFPFDFDESRVLYKNDFENDLGGWLSRGPEEDHFDYNKYTVKVELTDEEAHSGKQCMKISGREKSWNGAILDITKYICDGIQKYEALIWVKLPESTDSCRIHLSLQTISKIGGIDFPDYNMWDDYSSDGYLLSKFRLPVSAANTPLINTPGHWDLRYPKGYSTADGWVLLRGITSIKKRHYDSVHVYIETTEGAIVRCIYADDFMLLKGE